MCQLTSCLVAGDGKAHLEGLFIVAHPGTTVSIGDADDRDAAALIFLRTDLGLVVPRHFWHCFEDVVGYLAGACQAVHPAVDGLVWIGRGSVLGRDGVKLLYREGA